MLIGLRVLSQVLFTEPSNLLEHLSLVVNAKRFDILGLKLIIIVVRVGILLTLLSLACHRFYCLALDLVQDSYVIVKDNKSNKRQEVVHDWFHEVSQNTESLTLFEFWLVKHVQFLWQEWVLGVEIHVNWNFIGIVVRVVEAIIKKESAIAFATVTIIDLFATSNVFNCFDHETFLLINILPGSLSRSLMIEHICIAAEAISLESVNANAENS